MRDRHRTCRGSPESWTAYPRRHRSIPCPRCRTPSTPRCGRARRGTGRIRPNPVRYCGRYRAPGNTPRLFPRSRSRRWVCRCTRRHFRRRCTHEPGIRCWPARASSPPARSPSDWYRRIQRSAWWRHRRPFPPRSRGSGRGARTLRTGCSSTSRPEPRRHRTRPKSRLQTDWPRNPQAAVARSRPPLGRS